MSEHEMEKGLNYGDSFSLLHIIRNIFVSDNKESSEIKLDKIVEK